MLTAPQLVEHMGHSGWQMSPRTATRVLADAKALLAANENASSGAGRLAAVR
jgi:hypothetical protein